MKLARFAMAAAVAALPAVAQTQLTGAGATFPAPIYQRWFSEYASKGSVQINYQPIGSGGGIKGVNEGTVDFGASDMPLDAKALQSFKEKHGFDLLMFPTVLGAAVPSYNLPGVSTELKFTPEVLAGIYLGKIKMWNDPQIAAANKGVNLPADKIVVVHRSEGSGTTFCWTDYLSKISPEWLSKVGRNASVDWPTGLGAKGNDGVAGLLKQQKGAFGYVELIYAISNHLPYGMVQNKAGQFVKADLASVAAAAASVKDFPANFVVSITDAPGNGAYPISTYTWLLIPSKIEDAKKRDALKGFLNWAITAGQNDVESLDYARLPKSVVSAEQKQTAKIM
ncbi:MAG TPA: phosphate ABC transporter substrate-binding protein PstS [Bryobacteraceae bacterium]|nr:phosphate ABC transporter substrate-binding protein PstS [Bryobacteraceae bacterium]